MKGDDKVEQELLSRRTTILACSTRKYKPFSHTYVSEEDRKAELALYDRYFEDMRSFAEPDSFVGAPPDVPYQSDSLVVLQDFEPVSEFSLPDNESIISMEYCCLPVEKISQTTYYAASSRSGMAPQMNKKKAFVVVGTHIKDKHGEDSPGEGRLLLFGLGYKSFQTEEERLADELRKKEEEEKKEQARLERERQGLEPEYIPQTFQMPSDFGPQCTPKLNLLWSGPGSASIVKAFGDYVISTVDNTLFVYRYVPADQELEQIAFFKANIYIKSVSVERNYIMISDFLHGVQFLVWSRDEYTLTLLGKDYNQYVGLSTSFLRDHGALGMVICDDEANLQLLHYAPLRAESKEGNRLLLLADFHLGSEASTLLQQSAIDTSSWAAGQTVTSGSTTLPPSTGDTAAMDGVKAAFKERIRQRQAALQIAPFAARSPKKGKKDHVFIGTLDGGLGILSAVEEKTYRRLALLQQIMITSVRSVCALNPREFRLFKTNRFRGEKKRGILDGTLLYQYISLDGAMQDEIAAAMGVTADLLLNNLREIDLSAASF